MARGSAGESVLSRHLRVLGAFDVQHPFLTLAELTGRAGLAASSAHRLVGELAEQGLLERLPDRTYRLGSRLFELASRTPGALGLREIAGPILREVHSRVRQHTQLGIRSGRDVLYVERMSARDAVVNVTLVGGRIPLHASSVGLVLLAHAPADLVDDVLDRELVTFTTETIRTGAELRARLGRVRADGHAVTDGHIHLDARGVAVPIFGAHGEVVAGVGLVVPNDGSSPAAHIELLTRAAVAISSALRDAYLPPGDASAPPGARLRPLVSSSTSSMKYLAEIAVSLD
ncbi:MAG: IclR family transcriptional regulator [Actinobacteria bacterium]|nr:IclR family transcriptional regulator [Actinomycetota bacterium]